MKKNPVLRSITPLDSMTDGRLQDNLMMIGDHNSIGVSGENNGTA